MHIPVLVEQVIELLQPQKGKYFIDATVNGGGHAKELLKRMRPDGILVGIERDKDLLGRAKKSFLTDKRFHGALGNFKDIKTIAGEFADKFDGILFDLGMSSLQIEGSGRGFSFQRDEPLDMRYDINSNNHQNVTAADIVNGKSAEELADIFWKYGEERFSRRIARNIVEERKRRRVTTTYDLVAIIERSVPKRGWMRLHPATKVFQALRIEVNGELEALTAGLEGAWSLLGEKGRIAVISFHSLEDRIVKTKFRQYKTERCHLLENSYWDRNWVVQLVQELRPFEDL